jgi:hypothetical protein
MGIGRNSAESGVERAVGIQPGNVVARDRRSAVGRKRGKNSADENLAVRLDDEGPNYAVGVWGRNRRPRIARTMSSRRPPAVWQLKTMRA